ncbi:MAG: hypothetical protein U5Q44_01490 [Dehalococcoidia bacterium]|nr:hypothetical protein [Dehalococcoidia bacterium]
MEAVLVIPWKLVDAVFGRLWLLAIPILLVPIVAVSLTQSEPEYWSRANIWVSRPDDVDTGVLLRTASFWETAAQAQGNVMQDLLATESFRSAVAERAGISGVNAADIVGRAVSVHASGNNLVTVSAQTATPTDAPAIVSAVIAEYEVRSTEVSTRTAALQVEYFTTQLELATQEYESRRSELIAFETEHPLTEEESGSLAVERSVLTSAVESQQLIVDNILEALQEAQRDAASAPQALAATFNVQDTASPPQVQGISATAKYGYPAAGLLFGAAIAATYLYVAYRTDHAIRTSQDLAGLPVPQLGFVPQLQRGEGQGVLGWAPFRWVAFRKNRDFARNVAASISKSRSEGIAP